MKNALQHGVLMLQPKCNMACPFCVTEEEMGTMDEGTARALLRNLRERGFVSAIFGGGEPFYWPHDLKELLRYAKSLGLATQVGTNAVRLPGDFSSWDFVDRWVLPLDGATAAVHNSMRPYQGRHREIIEAALRKLKEAGRMVTISTVITKMNREEIADIGSFLRELQDSRRAFIHAWHLYRFLPFGRGGAVNHAALELPEADYESIVENARRLSLPFPVFRRSNMMLSETVEFFWMKGERLMAQSRAHGTKMYSLESS